MINILLLYCYSINVPNHNFHWYEGLEGGFTPDEEKYTYEDVHKLVILPEFVEISLEEAKSKFPFVSLRSFKLKSNVCLLLVHINTMF